MDKIIIYTDGSSLGNPGKGGWAAILLYKGKRAELSEGYELTTNNRMEMMAIINALKAIKDSKYKIKLHTDSRLIVDTINKGWLKNWKRNNWVKSDKKAVLNIDLWKEIDQLLSIFDVEFVWVQAHVGIVENERCDVLCKQAAASSNLKIDTNYLKEI
ncbi:MAG TPA: ribonuclease HI [Candidatus Kapabacteria bacterium]|nr:ribonuclease HI [Candidatus Kapabacteria bacterium]